MATMMRCTQPHWQGNTFIAAGTLRPEGHREVIAEFFEPFEVDLGEASESTGRRAKAK